MVKVEDVWWPGGECGAKGMDSGNSGTRRKTNKMALQCKVK